jgi:hypothetical protein
VWINERSTSKAKNKHKKKEKREGEREKVTMALKFKETNCPAAEHDKIFDLNEGTVWHVLSPVGRLKCDYITQ